HVLFGSEYGGGVPGRPLRERGIPQLPTLTITGPAGGDPDRQRAADQYREFARYERASVDAFLCAAVLLEQLGAPSELIERHRDAAREEAGHARLALAAALALDGRAATLAELPVTEPELELDGFVRDLIHDGCIGELIAAREAEWALAQACVRQHQALRSYWTAVVDEEAGHAELAWRALEWLMAARPELVDRVVHELRVAIRPRRPIDDAHHEALGLPAAQTRATLRQRAIDELLAHARLRRTP